MHLGLRGAPTVVQWCGRAQSDWNRGRGRPGRREWGHFSFSGIPEGRVDHRGSFKLAPGSTGTEMDLGGTLLGTTDGSILIIELNQFWFCFVWGPHPAVLRAYS